MVLGVVLVVMKIANYLVTSNREKVKRVVVEGVLY